MQHKSYVIPLHRVPSDNHSTLLQHLRYALDHAYLDLISSPHLRHFNGLLYWYDDSQVLARLKLAEKCNSDTLCRDVCQQDRHC